MSRLNPNPLTMPREEGPEHVSGPLARVMADIELKMAARALMDRDCRYDGPNIVIPCNSHAEAIQLVRELRTALERAA